MSFLLLLIMEAFPATLQSNLQTTGRIGIDYFEAMEKESKIQEVSIHLQVLDYQEFWLLFQIYSQISLYCRVGFFLCEMRVLIQQDEICKVFTVSKTE